MNNSIMILQQNNLEDVLNELEQRKLYGPVTMYVLRLSPSSVRTLFTCLKLMLKTFNPEFYASAVQWLTEQNRYPDEILYVFDWHKLQREHMLMIRARLIENFEVRQVNLILTFLRQILAECHRLELMDSEQYKRAADVPSVPTTHHAVAGRAVGEDEIQRMVRHCLSQDAVGIRDAAIIATFSSGIRAMELSNLDVSDVDLVTARLQIMGKGRRERFVFLSSYAMEVVHQWIKLRGHAPGPLFCHARSPNFFYHERRLGYDAILFVIRKRAEEAKVDYCTPHDLRRGVLTDLLAKGTPVETVAGIAGHSSVDTLARHYDRRDSDRLRAITVRMDVPFLQDAIQKPDKVYFSDGME
jgi:integrase